MSKKPQLPDIAYIDSLSVDSKSVDEVFNYLLKKFFQQKSKE